MSLRTSGVERQDPRVRRTRQLLRQALEAMLAEKSFQSITVQAIAERATVNRATFYAHFPDKHALLEFSIRSMFHDRLNGLLPQGPPLSPQRVVRLIRAVCEFLAETDRLCPPPRGLMETLMEKQVKFELVEVLLGWMGGADSGNGRAGPGPELTATMGAWGIYAAAVRWMQMVPAKTAEAFALEAAPLVMAGLQPTLVAESAR